MINKKTKIKYLERTLEWMEKTIDFNIKEYREFKGDRKTKKFKAGKKDFEELKTSFSITKSILEDYKK